MGTIKINNDLKILIASFEGDYKNEEYKNMWYKGLYEAKSHNVKKIYIKQHKVGKVSFMVRSWVILIMLPLIRKELGDNVALSVLPAGDSENFSRAKYFIKMAQSLTPYKINLGRTEEECIDFLNSVSL